jgi:hypothetical protein
MTRDFFEQLRVGALPIHLSRVEKKYLQDTSTTTARKTTRRKVKSNNSKAYTTSVSCATLKLEMSFFMMATN